MVGSFDLNALFQSVIDRDYDNLDDSDEWPSRYPKGFWRAFSLAMYECTACQAFKLRSNFFARIGPLIAATIGFFLSLYMTRCLGRRLAIRQLCILTSIASLGLYLPLGDEILSISSTMMLALSTATWNTLHLYAFEMVEPSKRKSTMLKLLL